MTSDFDLEKKYGGHCLFVSIFFGLLPTIPRIHTESLKTVFCFVFEIEFFEILLPEVKDHKITNLFSSFIFSLDVTVACSPKILLKHYEIKQL